MNQSKKIVNQILVELFNDILQIEEQTIKEGVISDLSITEIHTIEAIGMYKKRTMSEVAQDLKITVGTLTTAINKLIKKGYVERSRIEEDRRVVLIALNKKGKLAYRLHEKFHNDMVSNSIESLTQQEEAMLISALNKINEFLREKYKLK